MTKIGVYHFYPSAKIRREQKIKTSGVIFRGASAYYVQKAIAPEKQAVCRFSDNKKIKKIAKQKIWDIEKWNVGDRLKRVSQKFEAEWSHPWGINSHSKFFY